MRSFFAGLTFTVYTFLISISPGTPTAQSEIVISIESTDHFWSLKMKNVHVPTTRSKNGEKNAQP